MTGNSQHLFKELLSEAESAINSAKWDTAKNICKKILALQPDRPDAAYLLGLIYQNIGDNKLSVSYYERVLAHTGCHADTLNNLATIFESSGNTIKAVSYYRKAIQCDSSHFLANYNLGRISRSIGDLRTAINSLQSALDAVRDSVPVLLELALALKNSGKPTDALPYLLEASKLAPENPAVFNLLGNIYQLNGELNNSISCYKTVLRLHPDFAEAHNNLGSTYIAMGDVESGLKCYRKAYALRPDWNGAFSNILLAENYISDDPEYLYSQHQKWGSSQNSSEQAATHCIIKRAHNKIKIGYVSPDLRAHSVAWFLFAFLDKYDHDNFHVTCFSDSPVSDDISNAIMSLVDEWHDVTGLSDKELLKRIRECNIDILIDLAGHTAGNRLGVFAMQASPIQVTYLGYPNTTGLSTIRYRITDNHADPTGISDKFHTELLVRLPQCFLCYTPNTAAPECAPSPILRNNFVTFGSFNVLAKLSDACIKSWSEVLLQLPGSRLLLKSTGLNDPDTRVFIGNKFEKYNVDPQRIEMLPRTNDMRSHLILYNCVDIALDTYPYNGTTTTCEALWMGVPVVSLIGNRHAGRVGYSLLTQVGLEELLAKTPSDYVSIAKTLALDRTQLVAYRNSIRNRMIRSPLCDRTGFTRSLENSFKQMLRTALRSG